MPGVFNVECGHARSLYEIVKSIDTLIGWWSNMFSPAYRSAVLLDGFVTTFSGYGFPFGSIQSGTRVIGFGLFRLPCHLLELEPPSQRLKGEARIEPIEDLLAALGAQRVMDPDVLAERARDGLANHAATLSQIVRQICGDDYLEHHG